jgi:hypothetical protein
MRAGIATDSRGLAQSPFAILDACASLHLVTDAVDEDDVLYLALACHSLRNVLAVRFGITYTSSTNRGGARWWTRDASICATISRLAWVRSLPEPERPVWLSDMGWDGDSDDTTLRARGVPKDLIYAGYRIAKTGQLDVLSWAHLGGCSSKGWYGICRAAAQGGHPRILKFARSSGCTFQFECESRADDAADPDYGRDACVIGLCSLAAKNGHLEVLQWFLLETPIRAGAWTFDEACLYGHLSILQWLHSARNRVPSFGFGSHWDEYAVSEAAKGGHMEVLRWLSGSGYEHIAGRHDACPCMYAASWGDLQMLQWLRAKGCSWDEDTCSEAAAKGHLEVLQWARANGCEWDRQTTCNAARGGHLDVLQWACVNTCPWDKEDCLQRATGARNARTRRWLQTQTQTQLDPNPDPDPVTLLQL